MTATKMETYVHQKQVKSFHQGQDEFVFNKTYFSTTNLNTVCVTGESECALEDCNLMRNAKLHRILYKTRKDLQESLTHEFTF